MVKIIIPLFFLVMLFPAKVWGAMIEFPRGIQTHHQEYVPQFNIYGSIQRGYDANSFFPIASYFIDLGPFGQAKSLWNLSDLQTRDTLPIMTAAGFNSAWPSWFFPTETELNHFDRYNMKVFAHILSPAKEAANNTGGWSIEKLKTTVADIVARHPNTIIGWNLFDEIVDPDPTNPMSGNKWPTVVGALKQATPNVPVYSTMNAPCGPWSDFCNTSGVWTSYTNGDIARLRGTIAGTDHRVPIMPNLQAFYEKAINFRMPTPTELRASVYASLVSGSTGITYFIPHVTWVFGQNNAVPYGSQPATNANMYGFDPVITPSVWQEIIKTNQEIATYKKVYLSLTSKESYRLFRESTGGSIYSVLKIISDEPETRYLLADNVDAKSATGKFIFTQNITKVTSLFDNRNVAFNPQEKSFTDNFPQL